MSIIVVTLIYLVEQRPSSWTEGLGQQRDLVDDAMRSSNAPSEKLFIPVEWSVMRALVCSQNRIGESFRRVVVGMGLGSCKRDQICCDWSICYAARLKYERRCVSDDSSIHQSRLRPSTKIKQLLKSEDTHAEIVLHAAIVKSKMATQRKCGPIWTAPFILDPSLQSLTCLLLGSMPTNFLCNNLYSFLFPPMALCDKSGDAGFEGLVARHPKLPLTPTVPESAHLAVTEVHELDWLKYAIIFLIASLPLLRRTVCWTTKPRSLTADDEFRTAY